MYNNVFSFFCFFSFFCLSLFVSLSVSFLFFLVASFDGLRPLLVASHCALCSLANKLRSFVLGSLTSKYCRQLLIISMLVVLNNFIRKQTVTKSTDERSDFSNGQASKPVNRTGGQVYIYCLKVVHFECKLRINGHVRVSTVRALQHKRASLSTSRTVRYVPESRRVRAA